MKTPPDSGVERPRSTHKTAFVVNVDGVLVELSIVGENAVARGKPRGARRGMVERERIGDKDGLVAQALLKAGSRLCCRLFGRPLPHAGARAARMPSPFHVQVGDVVLELTFEGRYAVTRAERRGWPDMRERCRIGGPERLNSYQALIAAGLRLLHRIHTLESDRSTTRRSSGR